MLEALEKIIPTLCHNNIYLLVKNILSFLLSHLFIVFVKYFFQIFLPLSEFEPLFNFLGTFSFYRAPLLRYLTDTFAVINTNDSLALFVRVCFILIYFGY